MGIHDRDYYRNEGPSVFDSLMPTGLVCRWLIGINIVVFLLQLIAKTAAGPSDGLGWVTDSFSLIPAKVWDGQVWRLVSFSFLHATDTPFHILFNMLFLWWFGSDVEQLYGRKEFLAIYLVSAFAGGVGFQLWSLTPQAGDTACIGASGAVTTMLILCACHFPRRIIYLFMILPMPIWLFAVLNIVQDVFGLFSASNREVAVAVHLSGAALGLAYFKWQFNFMQWFDQMMWWKHTRSRSRLKLYDPPRTEEPVSVAASLAPVAMDEHLEAKLDAVLEKIARSGKDSLTKAEQAILQQAAEMYKRRRS